MRTAKFSIFLTLPLLLLNCQENVVQDKSLNQPNVLFIAIDDLNDWIEPLGGHPQARTPNISKFSDEAITFNHAYTASPGCNPSRGAILSGLHTYTSGLYSNYQDWRNIPIMTENPTLNSHFKNNGYYTAGAGKIYHYAQTDVDGWDDYFPSITNPMPREHLPKNRPLNMPRYKYMYGMFDWGPLNIPDEETADYKSVNYIKEQLNKKHDKPFFMACGIYRPHVPWYVPKKYYDMFPLDSVMIPDIKANDTDDLSQFAQKEIIERGGNYHKHVVEASQWKKATQGYLASIAYADAMLGNLLNALAESNYADNTIIVLWSDHGWQLGEKNHWRKFALWENVNRSVLMIKAPQIKNKLPSGTKVGRVESLVSLIDIYPTLIDLCELPERNDLDGESLLPLLKNPSAKIERPIITTYDYGSYSVRFNNWHYIRYIDDSRELYDLDLDPEEWTNLASDPAYDSTMRKLDGFIPENPVDLPLNSLIELMEHHIAPIQSKEHYKSTARKAWMRRFENL